MRRNTRSIWGILIVLIFLTVNFSMTLADSGDNFSINPSSNQQKLLEIQKAIRENGADWIAGFNSVFTPQEDHLGELLGCMEEYSENSSGDAIPNDIYLPNSWDWRDVNGTNWVTSVKNQGGCGSCVAFGTIGALEAVVQIEIGQVFNCDLSEAYLFFCGGRSCSTGWYTSKAVSFVKANGVPDEECFPYKGYDMPCGEKANNWKDRLVRVSNTGSANGLSGIKNALVTYGPLVVDFDVYEDFGSYNGGIYEHVWGNKEGGHAVTLVGYNDDPGYWICKNSWGKNWGENGFFKIKYHQCHIDDAAYYFDGIYGNIQPTQPRNPNPGNGESNVEPMVNLSWTKSIDFNGDKVSYDVYLSEGNSPKDLIAHDIEKPWIIVDGLKKDTRYSWKVIARDEYGSQYSSDRWIFAVRPPLPPVVNGTFNGKANKEYTFTAYATDKDGLEYYWFFDWGDDTNSGWIGPYGPSKKIIVTHTWNDKGTYNVKVRYKEDGISSDWANYRVTMSRTIPLFINKQFTPFIREILYKLLDFNIRRLG